MEALPKGKAVVYFFPSLLQSPAKQEAIRENKSTDLQLSAGVDMTSRARVSALFLSFGGGVIGERRGCAAGDTLVCVPVFCWSKRVVKNEVTGAGLIF